MNRLDDIKKLIPSVLDGGDILFIVPPFARREYAVLGPHILQTIAGEMGYKADVLYLNILFASIVGDEAYDSISTNPYNLRWTKLGERFFARSAYGLPPLGKFSESLADEAICIAGNRQQTVKAAYEPRNFDLDEFLKIEEICNSFIDEISRVIAALDYKMVGFTTTLEQTNCSVAILNAVKKICPGIITLVGGKNCEGQMAGGIASLSEAIDFVFSGESEISFKEFLKGFAGGKLPTQRVITGEPLQDLDTISLPGYESFFKQMKAFRGGDLPKLRVLSYETSRGCWWGQKQGCSFCGNNSSNGIVFRQKSEKKVKEDLGMIVQTYPVNAVLMTDNIVPHSYYEKLLPFLSEKKEFPSIFYQENTNLHLNDLINLVKMRVKSVLVGIESLSPGLLNLMNKRVSAAQNLLLLRNALSVGIYVSWFMLWGFPGDKVTFYREILKLLPLIRHLQPPTELLHLILVRFSSYVENPPLHRISGLRPVEIYKQIYPHWADIDKLAYEFTADYPSEIHENPELIEEIASEIELWKESWEKTNLNMIHMAGYYCVFDGRKIGGGDKTFTLDYARAKEVMKYNVYSGSEYQKWALEEKLGVVVDSRYVPLVTASPKLLSELGS